MHTRRLMAIGLLLSTCGHVGDAVLRAQPPRGVAGLERVVIVSVDGLRPDLLRTARVPAIRELMKHGSYTMSARTIPEGYTVPSHVSMLTGVGPDRHGVTWNHHVEQAYSRVPTLFDVAHRAGLVTALAVGKTKLIVLARPGTLDHTFIGNENHTDALVVAQRASAFLRSDRPPAVLFVHFGDLDGAGHSKGWGSPEQRAALERVDAAVASIRETLHEARLLDGSVTVLTADHGGLGTEHRPDLPQSRIVPWIVSGRAVRQNFDLGAAGRRVDTTSTFATVCALLGIEVPHAVDGKPVLEIIAARRRE